MERVTITCPEDLDRILPRLVPYAPAPGSVIIVDQTAQPVAILRPEVLAVVDVASLAFNLRVFAGRKVFVYTVLGGDIDQTSLATGALDLVGARIIFERTIEPVFFGLSDDRDTYLTKGGEKALDEAWSRAERVVAGTEER